MKLKLEDKFKIIELYKEGHSISDISKKYKVDASTIKRIERQYREHGIESFRKKGKNTKYPAEFKKEIDISQKTSLVQSTNRNLFWVSLFREVPAV